MTTRADLPAHISPQLRHLLQRRREECEARKQAYAAQKANDPRRVTLSAAQKESILSAPGLPIPHLEHHKGWAEMMEMETSLAGPALARALAAQELELLLDDFYGAGLYAPSFPLKEVMRHSDKLRKLGEEFRTLLFDQWTDVAWAPKPAAHLSDFRQHFGAFLRHVGRDGDRMRLADSFYHENRTQWRRAFEREHQIKVPSRLEGFIAEKLTGTFEVIYDREATFSRDPVDGIPYGPFLDFATAFFREINYRTRARKGNRGGDRELIGAEGVARTLSPRKKKQQPRKRRSLGK